MSYPKNQVVKFDTPKLGLGLFKKNYLGRFLELKERAGSSMSTVSRLCSAPPLQPLLRSIVTSIKHRSSSSAIAPAYPSSRTWLVSAPRYLSLNSFASEAFVCPWMLMMIDTMVSLHCARCWSFLVEEIGFREKVWAICESLFVVCNPKEQVTISSKWLKPCSSSKR